MTIAEAFIIASFDGRFSSFFLLFLLGKGLRSPGRGPLPLLFEG
jgi:hypothetical protein